MTDTAHQSLWVTAAVLSDVGRQRQTNEDSVRFFNPGGFAHLRQRGVLAVVADGMGGHSAGDVASRMAAECVGSAYFSGPPEPGEALRGALKAANQKVFEHGRQSPSLLSMGTTCTALALRDGFAHMAHVGDSRLYLVRAGDIFLMTEDDSAVMEMVKEGRLDQEEARTHEDRNVIVRALGTHEELEVSTWKTPLRLLPEDRFVLSSDGLHDLVRDEEICAAAVGHDPHAAARRLVALANERGGHDNITVAILLLQGDGERREAPATREVPSIT